MKECDVAVEPFSTRFTNIPTADEINNELSTAYSRKIHCSQDEDLVILIADGGYSYLNAVHMSSSESAVNWSGQNRSGYYCKGSSFKGKLVRFYHGNFIS